ncbi:Uncharacterized protein dnm_016720 [Desulfonema magnum]|uniref:Uncharacterized protein n=1 Tax=Desulfonema magnum TaxID=45655 RepID=A0A975BIA7_9BACT|nr:Uncharacterized protein dnm_016720 [Desulfonema magnum]
MFFRPPSQGKIPICSSKLQVFLLFEKEGILTLAIITEIR